MSWLREGSSWEQVLSLHPGSLTQLVVIDERLWTSGVPSRILELCRLRLAQLLGCDAELTVLTPGAGVVEEELGWLSRWPTASEVDEAERVCLEVAEQVGIDAHAVTDEQVAAVRHHLGEVATVGLFVGLAVFEGIARGELALGARRRSAWRGPRGTVGSASLPGSRPTPRGHQLAAGSTTTRDGLHVSARIPVEDLGDDAGFRDGVLRLQPALCEAFLVHYGMLWSEGELDHTAKEIARIRNARMVDCGW